MIKVVCVNGKPGSGKTTFERFCQEEKGFNITIRSTVDKVKEIAKLCGWDGRKTPRDREFLSNLKDLLTEYNDLPLNDIKLTKRILEDELNIYGLPHNKTILMCDVREPKEIEKMKNELGAVTVLVKRDEVDNQPASNHADAEVMNYNYDYIIDNNGSLDDLRAAASNFLEKLTIS